MLGRLFEPLLMVVLVCIFLVIAYSAWRNIRDKSDKFYTGTGVVYEEGPTKDVCAVFVYGGKKAAVVCCDRRGDCEVSE